MTTRPRKTNLALALLQWRMAWRNLWRQRRRTLISGLSLACGCAGLILMGSYIVRTEHYLRVNTVYVNHTGHLSLYKPGALERFASRPEKSSFSGAEQDQIAKILASEPGIEFTGRYLLGMGLVGNGCVAVPFTATGGDPEIDERIRHHPEVLRWTPELRHMAKGTTLAHGGTADGVTVTASLGEIVGKPLVFADVGRRHGDGATIECDRRESRASISSNADVYLLGKSFRRDLAAADATIVGHHRTGVAFSDETSLETSLAFLQNFYDTDRVTYFAVFLRPGVWTSSVQARLTAAFARAQLPIDVLPFFDEQVGHFYVGVLNFLFSMAAFFYLLILLMVIVTTVHFLTIGLLERHREIGTLLAIGYRPRQVMTLFLRETLALAFMSVTAGVLMALAVIEVVNHMGIRFRPPGIAGDMAFILTPDITLCTAAAVLLIAIAWISGKITLHFKVTGRIIDLLQDP